MRGSWPAAVLRRSDVGLTPPVRNVVQSEVLVEVTWRQALLRRKERKEPVLDKKDQSSNN